MVLALRETQIYKFQEATIMVLWGDLRGWLAEVEKIGELVKIEEPTDWNEEISGITYLVGKKKGGPALQQDCSCPGFALESVRTGYDQDDKRYL
jgi:hypothetical protein